MSIAQNKALIIFRELCGTRADQLTNDVPAAQDIARSVLEGQFDSQTATDIAFHMTDWNYDAAFITAFLLFPDRFTQEEIAAGFEEFLIHAPNHIAAAAKQHGYPVEDIFRVGALDNCPTGDNSPDRA